jgi:hypothetical protein
MSFSKGYKYEYSGGGDSKTSKEDMILGSGNTICLMGGMGHKTGSSNIWANHSWCDMTVGGSIGDLATDKTEVALAISAIVISAVAAAAMAVGSGLIMANAEAAEEDERDDQARQTWETIAASEGVTTNPTPQTADEQAAASAHVQERETAKTNQHILEGAAGAAQAVSLALAIASMIKAKNEAADIATLWHTDYDAKVSLDRDEKSASVEAKKKVMIMVPPPPPPPDPKAKSKKATPPPATAKLTLASGAKIDITADQTGQISIQVGTTGIVVKNNDITITGTKVNVKGSLDVGNGALTVNGAAPLMPDKLPAELAKIQADAAKVSAQKAAEAAKQQVKRAVGVGGAKK